MDSMQQPSGLPVRSNSGIPRPTSRLPVLRPSGSQGQLRSPPSTDQLRKKPSLSSLSRPSQPPPSLQKKPSRTSLSRPISASVASTNTTSKRASAISSSKRIPGSGQVRASIADASVFKKPLGRPPSRQSRTIPQPLRQVSSHHNEDVLGDLDAFRSASRASSRASSRVGFRETEPEPVLEDGTMDADAATSAVEKARPSLSQRTVESLSQLPSSPAGTRGRRRSSFFSSDNSMPPPPRPASALSNGSRPVTSDGAPQVAPSTPRRSLLPPQRVSMTAPGKRSVSDIVASASATPSKISSVTRPVSTIKKQPLSQVQNLQTTPKLRPLSNSKTMVARTPKSRPSLAGTFGQAISPPGAATLTTPSPAGKSLVTKRTPEASQKSSNSSAALREQIAKAKASRPSDVSTKQDGSPPKTNSSRALRDQIAKARAAAKRGNMTRLTRTNTPPRDAIIPDPDEIAGFDFGLEDPFNQRPKGGTSLLRKRIDAGRTDGRLNIAAMGLDEMPSDVLTMYQYDPDTNTVAWGEVVDLTSLIAADNNMQVLPDVMFPDIDYESAMESEEAVPQFGGVQNMDFHGNVLRELPIGLRRLTQLSKLNVSRNKLSLVSLDVVFQIPGLRELKLADNELEGAFPIGIQNLAQLETLELQGNKLTSLPPEIRALTQLRSLNISDNRLTNLPNELVTSVPLVELIASKNALTGCLFNVASIPQLQKLQLSNNALTEICHSSTISLPSLTYLDLTANRLAQLPNVSAWSSLVTLLMGGNKLSSLPDGFTSLSKLRTADFTGNDLRELDDNMAFMETLENITLAANPLRDRKFLSMNAEDIKANLMSRLEPVTMEDDTQENSENPADSDSRWKLTPSGTLDLSSQSLAEIDGEAMTEFAETHDIKQLHLQQNSLIAIPLVTARLSILTMLDVSKNNICDPLTERLVLPKLRELRLNSNRLRSLKELTEMLSAPNLQHLNVSNNHISGSLPNLREFFPELMIFLASDNSIDEVSAESLQGLKIVNLNNNDIARLEPRIGLHAGTLTGFEVEGNKFRVPNYAVLRKGTDAILNWLKDKIPSPMEEFSSPGSPGF